MGIGLVTNILQNNYPLLCSAEEKKANSLPVRINHLISKNKEEISAKTSIFNKLHSNVLTPEKIPEFFLPPKQTKRCLMADAEKSHSTWYCPSTESKSKQTYSGFKQTQTHPIFTEMLRVFVHSLERTTIKTPKLSCRAVLKTASTESDTPSADSSPYSTPPPIRREDFTCEQSISEEPLQHEVHASRAEKKKVHSTLDKKLMSKVRRRAKVIQTSHCTKLAQPIQFPLDMLHCQERFHQEHVLPLPQRGRVRVSAFRTQCSMTVPIHVTSVEGLRDPSDLRPLTCSLTLSLTPGKLQRQHSAIIRNCHNPVFNEDFFFQEPEEQQGSLGDLALRLKVLDKASGLGRGVVLGIVIKPLSATASVTCSHAKLLISPEKLCSLKSFALPQETFHLLAKYLHSPEKHCMRSEV
uniref:C2 domain-containing protein n=1 Tax=Sinocyclocheilus anshuiensis TaxID=1608454 RepID=A0A671R842_9TELE